MKLVRVAKIISAHGIRGEVKLAAFTLSPSSLASYGKLYSHDGKLSFEIAKIRPAKDLAIATLKNISNRNDAEPLKGLELYAATDSIPKPDNDAVYAHELIGMNVSAPTGEAIGKINGLYDFGAGEVVEIENTNGNSEMYPFNDNTVVMIDRAERKVIFSIPHME